MNLRDYIRGLRRGKEANQLERKAMEDPFLQDAIDGYDSVEGDHLSVIEKLEKQLPSPKRQIDRRIWIWAAAAAVILLIGTPLLLYKPYPKNGTAIVSTESPTPAFPQEKERSASLLQDDTLWVAEYSGAEKKEEQKPQITKETTAEPATEGSATAGQATNKQATNKQATDQQANARSLSEKAHPEAIDPVAQLAEVAEEIENVSKIENKQDKALRLSTAQQITEKPLISEPQNNVAKALADSVAGVAVSEQQQGRETTRVSGVSAHTTQPDQLLVSGRIVDEIGEPLPGVSIYLPDSRTGTVSDMEGKFQLAVPKGDQGKLTASYIGMNNTEIPLKENAGDIIMKSNEMALNEVVIVGFGTRNKKSKVGSISAKKEFSFADSASAVKDSSTTGFASVVKEATAFGEEQFRNYFIENYDKELCAEQPVTVVVEFFIGPAGQPGNIDIKENPCPALESEIKRLLLGSPPWSETDRKVTLTIDLP